VTVRFTPTGRAQFLAAIAYIRRENPTAAARFRQRAEQVLRRLEQFPESGRVVPEFPDLPYREVIVSPYRFFYRLGEYAGKDGSGNWRGACVCFRLRGDL
jgi:toxin ParE1/3/4